MPIDPVLPHDLDDLYGSGAEQADMADSMQEDEQRYVVTVWIGENQTVYKFKKLWEVRWFIRIANFLVKLLLGQRR